MQAVFSTSPNADRGTPTYKPSEEKDWKNKGGMNPSSSGKTDPDSGRDSVLLSQIS